VSLWNIIINKTKYNNKSCIVEVYLKIKGEYYLKVNRLYFNNLIVLEKKEFFGYGVNKKIIFTSAIILIIKVFDI